jgi:DNA repair exonuclease SbcCD nuclease subunit
VRWPSEWIVTNEPHARPSTSGLTSEIVIAHTSDLHIGGRWHPDAELNNLRAVLEAVAETSADVLILAGDVFDTNRTPLPVVERAAAMLSDTPTRTVILPGNHDPATADAVYRLKALADVPSVFVIGIDVTDTVRFPELDLDVWGTAHMDYTDMSPMTGARPREATHQVAVAHGHYVRGPHDHHRSWLIHDEELAATDADYIALGHWDLPQPAGDGTVPAYYSGSPDLAKTVNIVRLTNGTVDVKRHALHLH